MELIPIKPRDRKLFENDISVSFSDREGDIYATLFFSENFIKGFYTEISNSKQIFIARIKEMPDSVFIKAPIDFNEVVCSYKLVFYGKTRRSKVRFKWEGIKPDKNQYDMKGVSSKTSDDGKIIKIL